jgi:di/tricarboxylate transporter
LNGLNKSSNGFVLALATPLPVIIQVDSSYNAAVKSIADCLISVIEAGATATSALFQLNFKYNKFLANFFYLEI